MTKSLLSAKEIERIASGMFPCEEPTQYASGYTLDLYCDHNNEAHIFQEFPHQYTGETFSECAKSARKRGWKIHYQTRTATCPLCAKVTV